MPVPTRYVGELLAAPEKHRDVVGEGFCALPPARWEERHGQNKKPSDWMALSISNRIVAAIFERLREHSQYPRYYIMYEENIQRPALAFRPWYNEKST